MANPTGINQYTKGGGSGKIGIRNKNAVHVVAVSKKHGGAVKMTRFATTPSRAKVLISKQSDAGRKYNTFKLQKVK